METIFDEAGRNGVRKTGHRGRGINRILRLQVETSDQFAVIVAAAAELHSLLDLLVLVRIRVVITSVATSASRCPAAVARLGETV